MASQTISAPNDIKREFLIGNQDLSRQGNRSIAANYRPISLTSVAGKILEHNTHNNIMSHFD